MTDFTRQLKENKISKIWNKTISQSNKVLEKKQNLCKNLVMNTKVIITIYCYPYQTLYL